MGLCSSLDTLCSQSFGAGQKQLVGLVAQRGAVAFTLVLIPVMAVWLNTERLLLLGGQEAGIASIAAHYVLWATPTIFPCLWCEVATRYLQSMAITAPQIWIAIIANIFHVIMCWILIFQQGMGLLGAPLAFAITSDYTYERDE
jgi:MATE family multidrug resistance protein